MLAVHCLRMPSVANHRSRAELEHILFLVMLASPAGKFETVCQHHSAICR